MTETNENIEPPQKNRKSQDMRRYKRKDTTFRTEKQHI